MNLNMKKSYLKYIFALLLFGSNGIIAKQITLSSTQIVFWRTLIGSLLLISLFFITKRKIFFFHYKIELVTIGLSGIAMGASWIFLYEAYQQIGVSISSLFYYCGPVIVIMLSPILFHEKLSKRKITGFIFVLLGIVLINDNLINANTNTFGMFCGIISAVIYALMVIFNKKSKHIIGLENSMIQLLISFLTVAIFSAITENFTLPSSKDWMPILMLGIINTGIGCYFYFSSIGNLPVQTVAICGYLEPLSAVIFSVALLKETMSITQIIGALFIVGGAMFCDINRKNKGT